MEEQRKTIETFGKCYRLMYRVGAAMGDQFFIDLWSRESDSLLSDFVVFLKAKSEMVSGGVAGQAGPTVQHGFHVAQYHRRLENRIGKILELLAIVTHVGQTGAATPLLLECELLKLRLLIMDVVDKPRVGKKIKGDKLTVRQTFAKQNLGGQEKQSIHLDFKFSPIHTEILDFIKSRGEQVQNLEIFARFGNITRRTLKRKLSELVSVGSVTRSAKGKRVYYALSSTT